MKRSIWVLFSVFCILSSVDWLLPASGSDAPSSLLQQALIYGLLGIISVGFVKRIASAILLAVWGVALLGLPAVLLSVANAHLPDVAIATAFALVPAMVVLVIAQRDDGAHSLLLPAIAGFAGLLFVLPVTLAESTTGRLWLAAPLLAAAMTAVSSVKLYRLLREMPLRESVAPICLANAGVLLAVCAARGEVHLQRARLPSLLSLSNALHFAALALLLVLLREMNPSRLSSRFLLIPLLTVLEGFVLLHQEPTWRMFFGFTLAAIGAAWLLREKGTAEGSSLSLR